MAKPPYLNEEVSRVRNPNTDFVTIILEVWQGDKRDIATSVDLYLAVYEAASVPEQITIDPDYYSPRYASPKPLLWEHLQQIKAADKDAKNARDHHERWEQPLGETTYYLSGRSDIEMYQKMLDAIDVLQGDPNNQAAWIAVDAWRSRTALKHEK